jgi:hypothetical protein
VDKNVGDTKQSVKAGRPKGQTEFSYCPQCGLKGVYRLRGQYCRCRYCGLYRILSPEPDTGKRKVYLAIMAKQDKRR